MQEVEFFSSVTMQASLDVQLHNWWVFNQVVSIVPLKHTLKYINLDRVFPQNIFFFFLGNFKLKLKFV